jgi:lysozyme
MTNPICIDISHWQPDPDWKTLMLGGTQAVILKCTEGTGYLDKTYNSRITSARANNFSVAPYHFLKPGNAVEQMKWFVKNAKMNPGDRLVIDYEDAGCKLSELLSAVEYLMSLKIYEITVYGGSLLKEQIGSSKIELLANNTSLWLAQYTEGTPTWPKATWKYWSLWQYTDKASVHGLSVPCDGNKWNGSPDKLAGWFHKSI